MARALLAKRDALRAAGRSMSSNNVMTKKTEADALPRYLRVNTMRISVTEAVQQLEATANVLQDPEVPYILRVVDTTRLSDLVQHPLLVDGSVVIQDRSSCMSAILAGVAKGMHVLDICAAPGSKTLHCLGTVTKNQEDMPGVH